MVAAVSSRRDTIALLAVPVAVSTAARVVVLALDLLWPDQQSTDRRLLSYDGGWYAWIAQHGYPSALPAPGHQSALSFFPAYPVLIRATATVTQLSVPWAGLLVNLVLSVVAVAGVTWVASRVVSREAAVATGVLWSVLPPALVLSIDYSEALFVSCAVFALLAIIDQRWWSAGLLTGLATVTRPTGLAVLAALAVGVLPALRRRQLTAALGLAVAAAFPLALIGWQHAETGSWQAWYVAERNGWGGSSFGLLRLAVTTATHPLRNAWFDAVVVMGVAAVGLALAALRHRRQSCPTALVVYPATIFAVLAVSKVAVFSSSPRVLWTAFPLLIPAGSWLGRGRARRVLVPAASFAMMAALSVLVVTATAHVVP